MAVSSRVVVAMSGGIDSAVTALLLKKQGYEVEGVYMSNWDVQDEHGEGCGSNKDYESVQETCHHLGITCSRAEFVKEYWTDVFSVFLQDLQRGYTPNPDVLCNRFIKFGAFRKHVFDKMGVALMATGHYARVNIIEEDGEVQLLKSLDEFKDQTYFLSTVSQESLKNVIFPVGNLTKDLVREIARENNLLHTLQRKESMGLCFIGKRQFPSFLKEYIEDRPGLFVSHDGQVIGEHKGHHHFTIGQRSRIGGQKGAWFVSSKDHIENTVTIVQGSENPLLYSNKYKTGPAHWIRRKMAPGESKILEGRHRHQQNLITLCVTSCDNDGLTVTSIKPLKAITPGQYLVLYEGDECLGGACIKEVWPMNT